MSSENRPHLTHTGCMPTPHSQPAPGPVERDCICLLRTPDEPHIAQCNSKFRAKFFRAWRRERAGFYGS